MEFRTKYITPAIKLSVYKEKLSTTEVFFDHHMLIWSLSGETKIIQADGTYVFGPGEIFLIPRHKLTTVVLTPKDGYPHRSVAMHLSAATLKEFYGQLELTQSVMPVNNIMSYKNHPLLESFLASLIPYFDIQDKFPENIAALKITEAISILRSIDSKTDSLLANFEEPGKIDLVDFMEKNYMFNITMEKFGYQTGRSLTTFKRDFKKYFNMTPQKWLTAKRLELAYYYLSEKKRKPVDIYFEAGFENLSHFSFAFKKQYGVSPVHILNQPSENHR